jgi:hypothetical protein
LQAVRAQGPARVVCAVPVAAPDSLAQVGRLADDVVCLATPWTFNAVGQYYLDFTGVTDAQVIDLLALPAARAEGGVVSSRPVHIPAGRVVLDGDLGSPPSPHGLVIFVHGSGSSRSSPRNRYVADALNQRGLATLLFDLLTPEEDRDTATRFDIGLLSRRLEAAIEWVNGESQHRLLPGAGRRRRLPRRSTRPGRPAGLVAGAHEHAAHRRWRRRAGA